jgi:hypothetical protein
MLDDNVTHVTQFNPFPQESKLYFPVVERSNAWLDKMGKPHVIGKHKSLIRQDEDGKPQFLANVGKDYKTISNSELFPYIEEQLNQTLPRHVLKDVKVTDSMSYNGRDCWREYVFPNLRTDIDGGGDVAFRLIMGNSYGGTSLKTIAGAIDFFCTNGMIIGTYEKGVHKHTSGLSVKGIDKWVGDSVMYFTKHTEMLQRFSHIRVPTMYENTLFEHLHKTSVLSERRANELQGNMHNERNARSGRDTRPSLWHLYSALTTEATHFEVRNTGNDHEANTRISKQQSVNPVINAAEKYLLAA